MTLIEAQDKLIRILHRHIRPQAIAGRDVVPTRHQRTGRNQHQRGPQSAHQIQYHNAASGENQPDLTPTTQPQRLSGIITRRVIEKAIHHALGHLPVSEYMTGDIETLPLSATLSDIEELIIERRQRLIPIVHDQQLAGVITRTDLLNMLVNDPAHLPRNLLHENEQPLQERTRNLSATDR